MVRLILVVLLLHSAGSYCQLSSFTFTNYNTSNGLADNRVQSMVQDSRGFMWFATSEGLSRFDGTNFKNFFAEPGNSSSLPHNTVNHLFEYKPGHLLFMAGGKPACLNTFTGQFYNPPVAAGKTIGLISRAGNMGYFVASTDTCFIVNNQLQVTGILDPPVKNELTTTFGYYCNQNTILTGNTREYFLYNTVAKKYTPFLDEATMPPGRDRYMNFNYFDSLNNLLYFTNYFGGIFQYDLQGRLLHNWKLGIPPYGLSNGNISFISQKNDSILWIGNAEQQGLILLNLRSNLFSQVIKDINNPSSIVDNSLYNKYTDREGNEWICTVNGVSKIHSSAAFIRKWETGPGNFGPFIAIRKGKDSSFYLARLNNTHLWKVNSKGDTLTEMINKQLPGVWSLNNFDDNFIISGGGTTTLKYNPRTNQFSSSDLLKKYFPASDIVVLAFKHSNGDEWYSGNAGGGFVRIDAGDKSIHHYLQNGPAGYFSVSYYPYHLEDGNGDLWFGVNKSAKLLHWSQEKHRFNEISFTGISPDKKVTFSGITDLCRDEEDNIWVAFDGSGILKYNPVKNEISHYTIANGLPSNYVNSLVFDDKGRLWIGTMKGLACFVIPENKFVSFTRADGLPDDNFSDRCTFFDSSTHLMWIGSSSAMIRFDPEELLKRSTKKFPVYIDAITVNGKLFANDTTGNIALHPSQNNLQFSFIALDLEKGKNIEYSYKLDGADEEWIYNNNITTASYSNLAPGPYTFTVKARQRGGTSWNTMHQPFSFIINTPWYKTWWFRLSVVAVVAFLLWFIIRMYFQRKLERQRSMMEKEIAIEQERTKLARELHDGLGSMLSGVKHSFDAMKRDFPLNEQQQLLFHSNLNKLNESIKELRNISHNMASDTLLKYGLENSLRDYCNNVSNTSGISISYTALNTENLYPGEEKSSHIFRIMQELLQNIVKHSGAARVVVQVSCNNNNLYIAVEDDGKGFDMQLVKRQKGMGLKNIESRIKLLKGNLDYQAAPGKGTSVLIKIPCN